MPSVEPFECELKFGGQDGRPGAVIESGPDQANSSNAGESISARARLMFYKQLYWERWKWDSAGLCNQSIAAASRKGFLEHLQRTPDCDARRPATLTFGCGVISRLVRSSIGPSCPGQSPLASRPKESVGGLHLWRQAQLAERAERFSSAFSLLRMTFAMCGYSVSAAQPDFAV